MKCGSISGNKWTRGPTARSIGFNIAMDERSPITAKVRPNVGSGPDPVEDDPLVELARIVSGRTGSDERRRAVFEEDNRLTEADLARDIEAELISDLQATIAAMNDGGQDGDAPLSDAVEDAPVDPPAQFETQEDPRSGDDSHSAGHSGQGAVAPELSAGAFDDSNGADDPQTAPPDFGPAEAGREAPIAEEGDLDRQSFDTNKEEPPFGAGLFPPIIEPADLMASETQLSGAGDRDEAATPQPRRHRDHRLDAGSDDTAGDPPPRRGPRFYSVVGVIALITIGSAAILATQGGSDPDAPAIVAANDPGANDPVAAEEPAADAVRLAELEAAPQIDGEVAAGVPPDELSRLVRVVTVLADGRILDPADPPLADPALAVPAVPAEAAVPPQEVAAVPVQAPEAEAAPPAEVAALDDPPIAGGAIAPGFYVQVSAQGSEQAAQNQLAEYRARAPDILATQPAVIQRADLPQGIFYRVQFGPLPGRAEADNLMQSLIAVGIDAFVTTN